MRWTQILWNGNMQEIRPASWIQLIVWITMVCYENNCMKKLQVLCFFCWGRKINIEVPFETTVIRVSWESVWAHAESKKNAWGTAEINLYNPQVTSLKESPTRASQTQASPSRSGSQEESISIDLRSSYLPFACQHLHFDVVCAVVFHLPLSYRKVRLISI